MAAWASIPSSPMLPMSLFYRLALSVRIIDDSLILILLISPHLHVDRRGIIMDLTSLEMVVESHHAQKDAE